MLKAWYKMEKSKEILITQEAERKRIAEDLHDTTVQDLVHLSQQIEIANLYLDKDIEQTKLELQAAKANIKEIINGIRATIYNLRPMNFDDIGWNAAFDRLYYDIKDVTKTKVCFQVNKPENIDKITAITIYRIIREACNNVCKHANAKNLSVSIDITPDDFIKIIIIDDGNGFDDTLAQKENHFGLQMIREKVLLLSGTIDIKTKEKEGTKIVIDIPVKYEEG